MERAQRRRRTCSKVAVLSTDGQPKTDHEKQGSHLADHQATRSTRAFKAAHPKSSTG